MAKAGRVALTIIVWELTRWVLSKLTRKALKAYWAAEAREGWNK